MKIFRADRDDGYGDYYRYGYYDTEEAARARCVYVMTRAHEQDCAARERFNLETKPMPPLRWKPCPDGWILEHRSIDRFGNEVWYGTSYEVAVVTINEDIDG